MKSSLWTWAAQPLWLSWKKCFECSWTAAEELLTANWQDWAYCCGGIGNSRISIDPFFGELALCWLQRQFQVLQDYLEPYLGLVRICWRWRAKRQRTTKHIPPAPHQLGLRLLFKLASQVTAEAFLLASYLEALVVSNRLQDLGNTEHWSSSYSRFGRIFCHFSSLCSVTLSQKIIHDVLNKSLSLFSFCDNSEFGNLLPGSN